jgi:uncharacterized damage-inducible protein DinB
MKLITACTEILEQLTILLEEIDDLDYYKPSPSLSGATVGQHLRHTLEFFFCLEQGFTNGIINYDKRSHDKSIEQNKKLAAESIQRIKHFVTAIDLDKNLKLEVNYNIEKEETEVLETTAKRELVYNIEHAVHHMALMKIGIREVASYVHLKKEFGVAASTIRYQETKEVLSQ